MHALMFGPLFFFSYLVTLNHAAGPQRYPSTTSDSDYISSDDDYPPRPHPQRPGASQPNRVAQTHHQCESLYEHVINDLCQVEFREISRYSDTDSISDGSTDSEGYESDFGTARLPRSQPVQEPAPHQARQSQTRHQNSQNVQRPAHSAPPNTNRNSSVSTDSDSSDGSRPSWDTSWRSDTSYDLSLELPSLASDNSFPIPRTSTPELPDDFFGSGTRGKSSTRKQCPEVSAAERDEQNVKRADVLCQDLLELQTRLTSPPPSKIKTPIPVRLQVTPEAVQKSHQSIKNALASLTKSNSRFFINLSDVLTTIVATPTLLQYLANPPGPNLVNISVGMRRQFKEMARDIKKVLIRMMELAIQWVDERQRKDRTVCDKTQRLFIDVGVTSGNILGAMMAIKL